MKEAIGLVCVRFMDWLCGGPDTRELRRQVEALDDEVQAAMAAEDWDTVVDKIDQRQTLFLRYIDSIDPGAARKRNRNRW